MKKALMMVSVLGFSFSQAQAQENAINEVQITPELEAKAKVLAASNAAEDHKSLQEKIKLIESLMMPTKDRNDSLASLVSDASTQKEQAKLEEEELAKKQAELAKKQEAKKKAELAKQQEAKKKAELAKKQEAKKKAELAKKQEAKKKAELAKKIALAKKKKEEKAKQEKARKERAKKARARAEAKKRQAQKNKAKNIAAKKKPTKKTTKKKTTRKSTRVRSRRLNSKARPVIAARRASRSAHSRSRGWCAKYVRRALQAAGYKFTPNASAYQYATRGTLRKAGFTKISNSAKPQIGDVVVISRSRAHKHGHIAIYDGRNWVSDFRQKRKSPYKKYYPYTTWRDSRYLNSASAKGLYMAKR